MDAVKKVAAANMDYIPPEGKVRIRCPAPRLAAMLNLCIFVSLSRFSFNFLFNNIYYYFAIYL